MADEKNAAHNLLFEQRDKIRQIRLSLPDQRLAAILIAMCDILELQIRRIDELEAKA